MTQYFDLYGSTKLTMIEMRLAIESALGITFTLHDSAYRGGEYFYAMPHKGEELVIQHNHFRFDNEAEVAEPDYADFQVIFWIAWTDRGDELRSQLEPIDGLVFLRRKEC